MIHVIRSRATPTQIVEMQESLETYIKLAVDIDRGILAGRGVMHADCDSVLLEDGSIQENIWGADWNPSTQEVSYESLINLRPGQNNPSMDILDSDIQARVRELALRLLAAQ